MILFINDNNGFMFLTNKLVEIVSNIYLKLVPLQPKFDNKVLGVIKTLGMIYCKLCVTRLKEKYDDVKYITRAHTLNYRYNCSICGRKITSRRVKKGIGIY